MTKAQVENENASTHLQKKQHPCPQCKPSFLPCLPAFCPTTEAMEKHSSGGALPAGALIGAFAMSLSLQNIAATIPTAGRGLSRSTSHGEVEGRPGPGLIFLPSFPLHPRLQHSSSRGTGCQRGAMWFGSVGFLIWVVVVGVGALWGWAAAVEWNWVRLQISDR